MSVASQCNILELQSETQASKNLIFFSHFISTMNRSSTSLAEQEELLDFSEASKSTAQFVQNVYAVNAIVENKLYKQRATSINDYFQAFNISRAQVYRYRDCAWVLDCLADFRERPSRERICRILKKLGVKKQGIVDLWTQVLKSFDADTVSCAEIEGVHKKMQTASNKKRESTKDSYLEVERCAGLLMSFRNETEDLFERLVDVASERLSFM